MNTKLTITTTGALLTGRLPAIVQTNLDQLITEATMLLFAEVKKYTPQGVFGAQGGLLGSIQSEVYSKGTPLVKGVVVSAHKYAEVVEKGRTAGKALPPMGSLLRWIELKMGLSPDQAKRVEFVVRRSIGRKGFEGAHMFEKALVHNLNRLQDMADSKGLKVATELNR